LKTYLIALNVAEGKQKRALLLYQAGQSTQDIYDTLPNSGDEEDYETAMTKLNEYFWPEQNVDYEIFSFNRLSKMLEKRLICHSIEKTGGSL